MDADATCCVPAERIVVPDDPQLCEDISRAAKALGHPARVQILRVLLASDSCLCGDIVEQLPLAQSTVSQHLKVLKEAGLITGEIDGPRVCYCADREALAGLGMLIAGLLSPALTAGDLPVGAS
jgi:ArsR family transcriptional regulator